jgi:serine/threonine-protein kinase
VTDPGSLIGRRLTHYLVERRIGGGGMGEVYLARDLALGRSAALKVLRSDLPGDLSERLRREAHAFARLQHPWIATFYEVGEADGVSFLAMEYVPGETLRERLRQGALPPERALSVTSCLLEALAHAHAAGILHRDLKPENVVAVGEDAAKLLDFGIASRWIAGTPETAAGVTATDWGANDLAGAGTIGYSAPEQLKGHPVDARADIFSAGAVLYEAATGRPAFPGATATERMAAILGGSLALPSAAGLPPEWDAVVKRALAREPAARYPTAAAFLADVRRLRGGMAASALPDTIAVMDFANLSGAAGDAWISSGVAESVAADLARVAGLKVIARERVLKAAAGRHQDPLEVGHALGCRWILSGGVQRSGAALRLTARLTEVPTGLVAASEKLDGALESIFGMQDRLAEAVAGHLQRSAPDAKTHAPEGPEPTVRAYELYARGKRLADRLEKGTFDQAQELFEETVSVEPRHALALAGLAKVHAMKFTYTTDPAELDLAAAYARRSIEADPRVGEPHSWLAYALFRQGRYDDAVAEGERANVLEASGSYGPYFCACAYAASGNVRRGIEYFQRTVEMDPQHGFAWLGLGWCHLALGSTEEAIWCFRRVVALEGTGGAGPTAGAGGALAEALRQSGDLEGARASALSGLASVDKSDHMYRDTFRGICLASLGRTSLALGDAEAARAAFGQLIAHVKGRPRALGGGHLMAQGLAGLARATRSGADLDRAIALAVDRQGYDFSWSWSCSEGQTFSELAEACRALGRADEAAAWESRAREAAPRR